jgi:hypothetical protein
MDHHLEAFLHPLRAAKKLKSEPNASAVHQA